MESSLTVVYNRTCPLLYGNIPIKDYLWSSSIPPFPTPTLTHPTAEEKNIVLGGGEGSFNIEFGWWLLSFVLILVLSTIYRNCFHFENIVLI